MLPVVALVLLSPGTTAFAQSRQPDALYVTVEGASGPSVSGGGGEAEWLHWVSPRTSITVGGTSATLGDLWWTYGTVGVFTRRDRVMLSGRVSLGSGRNGRGGLGYGRYMGSATVPIARGFYAESESQYVRVAETATTVFKIGALYAGARGVTLQTAYYVVQSGLVRGHSVLSRGGFSAGRFGVFGGVTYSTQAVVQPTVVPATVLSTSYSRQSFVGASVITGRSQVIGVVEVVPQPEGRLGRVLLTWRLPLGQTPAQPAAFK